MTSVGKGDMKPKVEKQEVNAAQKAQWRNFIPKGLSAEELKAALKKFHESSNPKVKKSEQTITTSMAVKECCWVMTVSVLWVTFALLLAIGVFWMVSSAIGTGNSGTGNGRGEWSPIKAIVSPHSGRAVDQCGVAAYDNSIPHCGGILPIGKGRTYHIVACSEDVKAGSRCAWLVFSETIKVNVSFQLKDSSVGSARVVVGEMGNGLNCQELKPGSVVTVSTPLVLYAESDHELKSVPFLIAITSLENSDVHEILPGSAFMANVDKGNFPLFFNQNKTEPDFFAIFEAPSAGGRGLELSCTPVMSRCCASVAAYNLSFRGGGMCKRLTGLNILPGKDITGGDPVVMFFGPHKNVTGDAECKLAWQRRGPQKF